MFHNMFFYIVSCCVITVIIEELICTAWGEFIKVFKHLNTLIRYDFKMIVVYDFKNHISCFSLYIFYFINVSS